MIHRFRKIGTANVAAASTVGSGASNEGGEGTGVSGEERVTPTSSLSNILVAPQRRKSIGGIEQPTSEESAPTPTKPMSKWGRLLAGGGAGAGGGGASPSKAAEVGSKPDISGETPTESLTTVYPPTASKRLILSASSLRAKKGLQAQAIAEEEEAPPGKSASQPPAFCGDERKVQLVLDAIKSMQSSVINEITAVNRRIDMIDDHLLKLYEIVGKLKDTQEAKQGRQHSESDGGESVSSILRLFRKNSPPTKDRLATRRLNAEFVEMQNFSHGRNRRVGVSLGGPKKGRCVKLSRVGPALTESEIFQTRPDGHLIFQDRCVEEGSSIYLRPPPWADNTERRSSSNGGRIRSRSPVPSSKYDALLGSGDGLSSLSTLGGDDLDNEVAFHNRGDPQFTSSKPLYTHESTSQTGEAVATLFGPAKRETVVRSSASRGSSTECGKVSLL